MITPPPTVHNKQLWLKHCRKVRALAQRIIDGKAGIIEGSRQMFRYQTWLHAGGVEEFQIFRVVDSDTDHLPFGKVRELWAADALKEKDIEIKSIEDFYRKQVIEAAVKIRQKYEGSMKHK